MQTEEMQEESLPEDLQEQLDQLIAERNQRLDVFGKIVAKIKSEAVSSRLASGFETQWSEDEEYYDGVDEYNSPVLTNDYTKPRSIDGVVTSRKTSSQDGSTAFINITGAFTDYAAARMGDILLPANEWNFSISATPVPELDEYENDETPLPGSTYDQQGNQVAQPTYGDLAKQRKKEISDKVGKAETRIQDWLTECNYKAESRKVLENAAKVGTGILKGPVPYKSIAKRYSEGSLQIIETIKPESRCISHWDFFPDMNCGENIQDGSYVIERDHLTARQLRKLIGVDGYLADAIKKVIAEGPGKSLEYDSRKRLEDDDRFEVWYCYVDIDPDDMALLDGDYADECSCMEEKPESVSAVVVLVNDTVIKGYLNPMESGEYPYDLMVWRRVSGKPFGIGVPRQGRQAQKMLNASVRALMDNMGLSAIPMIAMLRKALIPADNSWKISKGKVWFLNEESGIMDIRQAIQTLVIPTMQAELMANIELAMKFMEDITGITFLLQGQQGSAPDTVGGMNLLHQNASTILRRCARLYDENVTEPHIRRYHEYLLTDPVVPGDEKGDSKITAVGSSHLVEREIQSMQLPMILQMISSNPMLEKSPKKAADEILRAFNFDPAKFDMDEEEKQQMANAQQGQVAPQVQAAQIRGQVELQKEQMRQDGNLQRIQVDTDRDTVHIQAQTQRDEQNHAYLLQKMQLDYELQLLKYANDRQITLDEAKKDLAALTMKLNLQKELAYNNPNGAEQVVTPVSEPAGRAPQGQAFQR